MAIKEGFIKTKHRRKLSDGDYQLESQWTSASTVEMANGNTVETEMTTHDTQNNITTFTNEDCETSTADGWTDIVPLTSGETHKSIFSKLGTMFRNLRYLFKEIGTTDISSIGDGTVKGAVSTLNSNNQNLIKTVIFTKKNFTVAAKTAVTVNTWDKGSIPEDYSLLGCIGFNAGTSALMPYTFVLNKDGSSTPRIDVRNIDSNPVTVTVQAKFLYIKNQ